ncbi:hypothetical protein N7510_007430 [Penicillium lagena]|uniref:uncharacterized protein n=1 Tax=Penicillium lagena TaxID=94218 RepID=UPI00254242BE|nr:uncharacterized protein N7510_007430 [Penicillium lagena]KAJ5610711.1 hypothetical protein N7510_007430 [Penicillium lagena]
MFSRDQEDLQKRLTNFSELGNGDKPRIFKVKLKLHGQFPRRKMEPDGDRDGAREQITANSIHVPKFASSGTLFGFFFLVCIRQLRGGVGSPRRPVPRSFLEKQVPSDNKLARPIKRTKKKKLEIGNPHLGIASG